MMCTGWFSSFSRFSKSSNPTHFQIHCQSWRITLRTHLRWPGRKYALRPWIWCQTVPCTPGTARAWAWCACCVQACARCRSGCRTSCLWCSGLCAWPRKWCWSRRHLAFAGTCPAAWLLFPCQTIECSGPSSLKKHPRAQRWRSVARQPSNPFINQSGRLTASSCGLPCYDSGCWSRRQQSAVPASSMLVREAPWFWKSNRQQFTGSVISLDACWLHFGIRYILIDPKSSKSDRWQTRRDKDLNGILLFIVFQ